MTHCFRKFLDGDPGFCVPVRTILLLAALTACDIGADDDSIAQPDAAGSVAYPCIVSFYPVCAAARDAAEATCARKERCDPLWDLEHSACVAREMESLCAAYGGCNVVGDYDRTTIDACIGAQATCDGGACHL